MKEEAEKELEKGYKEAEKMLKEPDKVEEILIRLEEKLRIIPKFGNVLAFVPLMISLVRDFIHKKYTKAPIGTIIAIVSALVYVLNPLDLVPDSIPGAGFIDDAFVVSVCLKLISSDIIDYRKWKKDNSDSIDE